MATLNIVKRMRNIMRMDKGVSGDAQRIEQMVWLFFLKVYDAQEEEWEYKAHKTKTSFSSIIPEKYRWRNWAHSRDEEGKAINDALTGDALLAFLNELFVALKNVPVTPDTPLRQALVRAVFADLNQYMKDGTLLRQLVDVVDEIDFSDAEDRHLFGDIYEGLLKDLQAAGPAGEFYTPRALTDFIVERLKPVLGEVFGDLAAGTCGFAVSHIKAVEGQMKTAADYAKLQKSLILQEWKPLPYLLGITNLLVHKIEEPNFRNMDSFERRVRDWNPDCDLIGMNPPYGGTTAPSVKLNFPEEFRSSETADLFLVLIMQRLKPGGRAGVVIPDGFLFGTDGAKLAIKRKLLKEFNLHTVLRLPGSVFSPYTGIATNVLFFDRPKKAPPEGETATKQTWFYRLDMPEGYKHFSKTKPMLLQHFDPVREWWDHRTELVGDEIGEKSRVFTVEDLLAKDCDLDQCKFPKEDDEILPPDELIAKYLHEREKVDREISEVLASIQEKIGNAK